MSPLSKTRWYIQWTMAALAFPIGAITFLMVEIIPHFGNVGVWVAKRLPFNEFFSLVVVFMSYYYLLSWWIHYRIDKKEGFDFAWRDSWRLKIGVYGLFFEVVYFWGASFVEDLNIKYRYRLPEDIQYLNHFLVLGYVAVPGVFIVSIFFTGWISEMMRRWKNRDQALIK